MNTEQLKKLGLDEDQIREIFKLNGLSIEKLKKQVKELKGSDVNSNDEVEIEEIVEDVEEVVTEEDEVVTEEEGIVEDVLEESEIDEVVELLEVETDPITDENEIPTEEVILSETEDLAPIIDIEPIDAEMQIETEDNTLQELQKEHSEMKIQNELLSAKLMGTQMGVNPENLDDVITLAKALVTGDLDLQTAIVEIVEKYPIFTNKNVSDKPSKPNFTTGSLGKNSNTGTNPFKQAMEKYNR